ncbi:54S ribosomal protein L6 mitochondrial [Microbotryomycetes sp. JL221]|nr:54S ribosomal protein L6 mitochondrial [Microbotryomycetes sp. JL221]
MQRQGARPLCRACCSARTARPLSTTTAQLSHIGSLPVQTPSHVKLDFVESAERLKSGGSKMLKVTGPKGQLLLDVKPFVNIVSQQQTSKTSAPSSSSSSSYVVQVQDATIKHQRAIWGLTRSLLSNAVQGVSSGFNVSLRLVGVGYRAAVEDIPKDVLALSKLPGARRRLNLKLGYAHPVYIEIPPDIEATTPSTTSIVLSGIDKQRIGELAARIRRWRKPEPYNGKGIFVGDEVVRRKEVKKK